MSKFFDDDLVALKADPSILGFVHLTWSDIEPAHDTTVEREYYLHSSCPPRVKRSWLHYGRIEPGYILLEFENAADGFCLIREVDVDLIDRSFAVDDVVKRSPEDQQSGTIVSTSMQCKVRPVCTRSQFEKARRGRETEDQEPSFEVAASDLDHYGKYREEDFVIYSNWIGQIERIEEEVSIRLGNGSVVVVDDPHDLRESCFEEGSRSLELHHRLENLGFCPSYWQGQKVKEKSRENATYCHNGMIVQTRKANLRLGRWVYGAYDPNVEPKGIVVDSRCIRIYVEWLFCNIFLEKTSLTPPPEILTTDEIDSGELLVYDRSRLCAKNISSQLSGATFSPDTSFAGYVKIKDGSVPSHIPHIPRIDTQGYDMNVYQISRTATRVRIAWQDGTFSDEDTTLLIHYANEEDHDVWPGEKVAYSPADEPIDQPGVGSFRKAHKVGVVQTCDSHDRLAQVRWYRSPCVDYAMAFGEIGCGDFGQIGEEVTATSTLELDAEVASILSRGKMVFVLPEPAFNSASDLQRFNAIKPFLLGGNAPEIAENNPSFDLDMRYAMLAETCMVYAESYWGKFSGTEILSKMEAVEYAGRNETINCFGEIVGLCLDGDIIVRLGASSDAREVKVATERVFPIADGDAKDGGESDGWDDDADDSERSSSSSGAGEWTVALDEGQVPVNAPLQDVEGDESMWETDEESPPEFDPTHRKEQVNAASSIDKPMSSASDDRQSSHPAHSNSAISRTQFLNMPESFSILETPAPSDHAYISRNADLSREQVRRISKEYSALATSLPDGVIARSWEQRLDLLRFLIVGPTDTPYEHSPFVFDLYLGESYPTQSPLVYFHSWASNLRVNPNLYEDGTVCLSLLGTWHSQGKNEAWCPERSTLLQIIVSVLGLVLVREPYYSK